MIKYLVIALVGYLVIGVVYAVAKLVWTVWKRYKVLGSNRSYIWVGGTQHLDEYEVDDLLNVDDWSDYETYIRFADKIYDANKALGRVVYILTWPTSVSLFIEVIAQALDKIYESRFGEEG